MGAKRSTMNERDAKDKKSKSGRRLKLLLGMAGTDETWTWCKERQYHSVLVVERLATQFKETKSSDLSRQVEFSVSVQPFKAFELLELGLSPTP